LKQQLKQFKQFWLVVSAFLKHMSQLGSSSQMGSKIKKPLRPGTTLILFPGCQLEPTSSRHGSRQAFLDQLGLSQKLAGFHSQKC
jgi:hypothetical protein